MSLTDDIKDYALDLGYFAVGITTADPFPTYAEELTARYEMYKWAIDGGLKLMRCADPKNFLPEAKSVVAAVYDYSRTSFPPEFVGIVGRVYLARCYMAPPSHIANSRSQLMREFLEKNGCKVAPWQGVISGVPDRLAATRAGLTWVGNNTFAIAAGPGSFIIINSFIVDTELQYDSPRSPTDCPIHCQLCIESCPTGAIIGKGKLDSRRCIGYLNWVTQRPDNWLIPVEFREKIGTSLHGCDICQEVCTYTQARMKARLPSDPYLEKKAKEFSLHKTLNATDEYYARVLNPIMYNYIRDKKFFQRNAAIVLGNIGDPDSVPHLANAMEDAEEVVRGHAAWALGKIGGPRAKGVLELSLARETDEQAKKEIQDALLRA